MFVLNEANIARALLMSWDELPRIEMDAWQKAD